MATDLDIIKEELTSAGVFFVEGEELKKHTSFRIGGAASFFCEPQDVAQLSMILKTANSSHAPYFILGQGTNVLFADYGYKGLIIKIAKVFSNIEVNAARNEITVSAGTPLKEVCIAAQQAGLAGLEFAFGIPGSVGGAVYMNAGAYGGEMKDVIKQVTFLDENQTVRSVALNELQLGYRYSIFHEKKWCILSATVQLKQGNESEIQNQMDTYWQMRESKQPLEYPSAGSAFKRPAGAFAGALIDQCGLRGYRVGDAAISEKHCGFIINLGDATCQDVLQLANDVAYVVKENTGFTLEKEIRVIEAR